MPRLRLIGVLLLVALLIACGGGNSSPTVRTLQSLQVAPATPSVALGNPKQFKATGTYSDGTTQDLTSTATWTSSQTSVATISANGLVNTKATGTSTIMATSGSVSGSTTLTVTAAALVSIAVTPPAPSVAAGNTQQFTATGAFTDGSRQDISASVSWTATASIASITSSGLAKGLAVGAATITAASGSISGSASLMVTKAVLSSIAITPEASSVPLGLLEQFTATGTFSDGSTEDLTSSVTWASSHPTIASIAKGGLAAARNLGEAQISAASGTIDASTTMTVNTASLNSITLGDTVTIAKNTSHTFVAIGNFNDGSTRNITSNVSWSSSDKSVATIPLHYPVATGMLAGTAQISAALNSIQGSANLTVTNATIVSISVIPTNQKAAPGTEVFYQATGLFDDGSSQVLNLNSVWTSSVPNVASIMPLGVVQALNSGASKISAKFGGRLGSTFLSVSSAKLETIAISPSSALIIPGSMQGFSAAGTYSDTSVQNITNVATWNSSETGVATVNGIGQAVGLAAGSTTIAATLNSVSGSAALVVESSPLESITISPSETDVPEGFNLPLTAIGKFLDGNTQNLTNTVTWTCSPSSVAIISNVPGSQGSVTGITPGSAMITAVFAGVVDTSTVNTTAATLTSITISPNSADIPLGAGRAFTATAHFSDSSSLNLNTQVEWSSSNIGVAVIGPTGQANSVAKGSTTITATLNGVSGTAILTIH